VLLLFVRVRPGTRVVCGVVNTNSKFSCGGHVIMFPTTELTDKLIAESRTSN
jgi:hypothetical protein